MKTKILMTILAISLLILSACQPVIKQDDSTEEKVCDVNDPESCPDEEGVLDEISKEETKEEKTEMKESKEIKDGSSELSKTITVDEGQMVSLKPKASDPDQDKILFTFSSPLNKNGEWETNHGDAGEYLVSITASGGKLQTTKKVKIIAKKVNIAPTIKAIPKEILAKEGEEIKIVIVAEDANKDALVYQVNNKKMDQNGNVFTWKTTYGDAGKYLLEFSVSDGTDEIIGKTDLTIERKNVAPMIEPLADIQVKEGEDVMLTVKASDLNGDNLVYTISDPRFKQDGNVFSFKTGYTDNGDSRITVTASDGEMKAERFFRLRVEDVNQAPVILDIE